MRRSSFWPTGLEVIKDEPVYGERSLITRRAVLGSLAETYVSIGRLEDALQVTELLDSDEQKDDYPKTNRIHVGVG
mgnify:CR=1 FL=1